METKNMETKTLEEKVRTVILEDIKILADEAWRNPIDDNINKLYAAVEYLKKTLSNNIDDSTTITWVESQPPLREPMWYDNPILTSDTSASR